MKPTDKELQAVRDQIATSKGKLGLSNAEIGRLSQVHPSQVGRICDGGFRTFSHNVLQICKALDVAVPRSNPATEKTETDWTHAESTIRKLWNETPGGARFIAHLLAALAELQSIRRR